MITKAFAAMTAILAALPAAALDAETYRTAREVQSRAIEFLKSTQDEGGTWSVAEGRPALPAITGLAVNGMLLDPRVGPTDEAVLRAVRAILDYRRPDGTIQDGILPTYNTAICLSALSRVRFGPFAGEAGAAVSAAVPALRRVQWGAYDPDERPNPEAPDWREPVGPDHPFFGGAGYGNNGRPDMSNTQFFMQALEDAGVSSDDPAIERALVFLSRTQMDGRVNDMDYAEGDRQGGFIYATVPNAESVDPSPGQSPGQSQAGEHEVELADGTRAMRLRAYGSMTYAGFKSLIYADLPPDDERLTSALGWMSEHYTLDQNPGMPESQRMHGYYYFLVTMARALDAHESAGGRVTFAPEWRRELVMRLAGLQQEDGSFDVRASRWMEDDENLIAAYALIAIGHAAGGG